MRACNRSYAAGARRFSYCMSVQYNSRKTGGTISSLETLMSKLKITVNNTNAYQQQGGLGALAGNVVISKTSKHNSSNY
jgi:hypothetical protein